MPSREKHVITFDSGAKQRLDEISDLPDLDSVSDDDRVTDICMFFGAAAYYAQFFEEAIAQFLGTYARLPQLEGSTIATKLDEQSLDKNTMGLLLKKLRIHFEIDVEIDAVLSEALTKRNYLMHEFFKQREKDFSSMERRPGWN